MVRPRDIVPGSAVQDTLDGAYRWILDSSQKATGPPLQWDTLHLDAPWISTSTFYYPLLVEGLPTYAPQVNAWGVPSRAPDAGPLTWDAMDGTVGARTDFMRRYGWRTMEFFVYDRWDQVGAGTLKPIGPSLSGGLGV